MSYKVSYTTLGLSGTIKQPSYTVKMVRSSPFGKGYAERTFKQL